MKMKNLKKKSPKYAVLLLLVETVEALGEGC